VSLVAPSFYAERVQKLPADPVGTNKALPTGLLVARRRGERIRTTPLPCYGTVVKDCPLSSIFCAFLLQEQWYKNNAEAFVYCE
jgi:hypothetical protein